MSGELTGIVLFFIGLYGLIARRNIIKSIISIGIMEMGIILYFLSVNFDSNMVSPVYGANQNIADPLPQALTITAIVVGVSITAITLAMFIKLYHKYGTTNWEKAAQKRRAGDEL